jgi:hypothetical protein
MAATAPYLRQLDVRLVPGRGARLGDLADLVDDE